MKRSEKKNKFQDNFIKGYREKDKFFIKKITKETVTYDIDNYPLVVSTIKMLNVTFPLTTDLLKDLLGEDYYNSLRENKAVLLTLEELNSLDVTVKQFLEIKSDISKKSMFIFEVNQKIYKKLKK